MSASECCVPRVTLAINLELSHGRHGASARVELHEWADRVVALVSVRGWIDSVALRRLGKTIDDLVARGVSRLVLDCSQLRHIEFRFIPSLMKSLTRFERGSARVCGLTRHLRDLFRLAGSEPGLHGGPSAAELLASVSAFEPGREWAS